MVDMGKLIAKRAKDRAGQGWSLLGVDLQEALVAREFASVFLSNATVSDNPVLTELAEAYRSALTRIKS